MLMNILAFAGAFIGAVALIALVTLAIVAVVIVGEK